MGNFTKTPHNNAGENDFAKTVLMPGDPLRAKFIAEKFFDSSKLINNVRGIHGYTGQYHGKRISVMGSGMGMPSIGIYSYELFNFYGVSNIIRVGSAAAISPQLNLHDIVLAQGACTNSNYSSQFNLPGTFAPICDYNLLTNAKKTALDKNIHCEIGNVLSSDNFYNSDRQLKSWQSMGTLCVEMETAALYMNAAQARKKALAILTISDCPLRNLASSQEREQGFTQMIEIALETAILAE